MSLIPQEEAARYGDTTFGLIMMAKVICVHLVSDLGYDMLFQDVDVVWYKDPLGEQNLISRNGHTTLLILNQVDA